MKAILVQKINSEPGDGNPNGTFGKAIYYFETPPHLMKELGDVKGMYGVIWDTMPDIIVHCAMSRADVIDATPVEINLSVGAAHMFREVFKVLPFKLYE